MKIKVTWMQSVPSERWERVLNPTKKFSELLKGKFFDTEAEAEEWCNLHYTDPDKRNMKLIIMGDARPRTDLPTEALMQTTARCAFRSTDGALAYGRRHF